jgi:hypothetical protein
MDKVTRLCSIWGERQVLRGRHAQQVLMLMFGWQGATCIDEWTMAACNLAIGATLMLGGSGAFSLDNALLARKPALAERGWFRWMSGALPLPVHSGTFQRNALAVFAATVVFNVAI